MPVESIKTSPEVPQSFSERLGQALSIWAEQHPTPDDQSIEFIGPEGHKTFSPRQLAKEVIEQTPLGKERTGFYLNVARNLGDETGERVIRDLTHAWDH